MVDILLLTFTISPYQLDKEVIKIDLSKERPLWILSAYGPGKQAPVQLFGGLPREQSFEELRLRHYELAAQGNEQQAIQEAQTLVRNAEQQTQSALNDIDGAIQYIIAGGNQHPNRIDICNAKENHRSLSNLQAAAATASTTASDFSRPPVAAIPASTFGQPSSSTFGVPSSMFGQTPALGRPANPFKAPSAPALGQTAISGASQTSTFGQPSSFGKVMPTTSAFGQPTIPSSTFGQATHLIPLGKPSNSFAQYSSQTSTFGKPSQPNPFGTQATSAFTTGTSLQNLPATTNPFGQNSSTQASSFGRPSNLPANPFARPTASSGPSVFPQTSTSAISAPSFFDQSSANTTASANSNNRVTSSGRTRKDPRGRLVEWKSHRISYIDDDPCFKRPDGAWEKVWFPDGPPAFQKEPDPPADAYDEGTKEQYQHLKQHGSFKDGIMPELPPMKEWCTWDF